MPVQSDTIKSQILSNIRSALTQFTAAERAAAQHRYETAIAVAALRPAVDGALVRRFIEKHTAVTGTYEIVAQCAQVPDAIQNFLNAHELPTKMVMSNTEFLNGIEWPTDWCIEHRTAARTDRIAVTDTVCAIAETGTFLMTSSAQVSSTHFYLPENHVVVMDSGQLVRHLDDAINQNMQNIAGQARGIHLITGPSKTADVEQTIQYGAHGPRRLHAVIVDSRTS